MKDEVRSAESLSTSLTRLIIMHGAIKRIMLTRRYELA